MKRIGWAILILWLAFFLRTHNLSSQSIWWDEGHSIFVASYPISQIPALPAMDVHPPAYFALLNLWISLAGSSEFALRYLSLAFSMLTVALLWHFATHLAGRQATAPWLAALLTALSPTYIAYAQEVRSYAMITCLALASTFVLWRFLLPGLKQDTPQKQGRLLALYVVLTAACLYTHYFTIFLLLFQNLLWLIWLGRGKFISLYPKKIMLSHATLWLSSQVAIIILFLPQSMLALRQVTSYTNPNLIPPSLSHFISQSWQAYTTGLTINPTPARWAALTVAVLLIISWVLVALTKPKIPGLGLTFTLLLLWLLLPLTAYFIILHRQPSFQPRYLLLITPALFLLLSLGLSHLNQLPSHVPRSTFHVPRPTPYILLILLLIPLITGTTHYFTNPTYFKDDSLGVANWLTAETTPNDIVYVDVPHPFHYYKARIPAPTRYLFVDIHTAADTLNREAVGRDRLYWVTWWGSDTDPRGVIPFLAQKAGPPLGQMDFKGYHVRWYQLGDKNFSLPNQLTASQAIFGDVLRLDGFALNNVPLSVTEPGWATLHFTLLRKTDTNYKVSLRLRDKAGQVVTQLDRDLLNDRHFHTADWPLTDPTLNQANNVYLLPLPPDTPPGTYQLEALIYNAQPPYPSEGVSGHNTTDGVAAILGQLTVAP